MGTDVREGLERGPSEEAEAYDLDACVGLGDRPHRNRRGQVEGVAVDAGGDRGERDAPAAELVGDRERVAMARGEQLRLTLRSAVPNRPDSVDDVLRRELTAGR